MQSSVRKGVLPSMLEEILKTRIMVKQSMKGCKNDKALFRLLNARQLGLKLIANVTFGYTSANFSGRMPSVEVHILNLWFLTNRPVLTGLQTAEESNAKKK